MTDESNKVLTFPYKKSYSYTFSKEHIHNIKDYLDVCQKAFDESEAADAIKNSPRNGSDLIEDGNIELVVWKIFGCANKLEYQILLMRKFIYLGVTQNDEHKIPTKKEFHEYKNAIERRRALEYEYNIYPQKLNQVFYVLHQIKDRYNAIPEHLNLSYLLGFEDPFSPTYKIGQGKNLLLPDIDVKNSPYHPKGKENRISLGNIIQSLSENYADEELSDEEIDRNLGELLVMYKKNRSRENGKDDEMYLKKIEEMYNKKIEKKALKKKKKNNDEFIVT